MKKIERIEKCEKGGDHERVPAVIHIGEYKCKKCDLLEKYWKADQLKK